MKKLFWCLASAAGVALAGCDADVSVGGESASNEAVESGRVGKMDLMLHAILAKAVTPQNAHRAMPSRLASLRVGRMAGKDVVLVEVLIQGSPRAVPRIRALGGDVRTVTSSGIMTATAPLAALERIAALTDVTRVEAAKSVHPYNDLSNSLGTTASGTLAGMNNLRTKTGAGVVVGVIDSGLDWTHGDFIKDSTECPGCLPQSRILYYWDQSDPADDKPPTTAGFAYGHEYVAADFDDALQNHPADTDPESATWSPISDPAYPIKASARDYDGHGTHVTGTSAGDGSASGLTGVAPDADIVFVKFDFDSVAGRNTDANIIDAVNYVFKRAAALGKPAVINMSLGSDFGPRDGSTLEERGIDDLTGPGKIVVVAAGNPGANNWSGKLRWGYAIHGSGGLNVDAITLRIPQYAASATDNYAFFDLWHKSGNKCRVKVTTPGGKVFPPSTTQYKNTWVTGSAYYGFNTTEGAIFVGNGGDQLGWGSNNGDQEVYIEISDYYSKLPVKGTWTISLVPATATSVCTGTYHAWYGVSDNVVVGWRDEKTANPLVAPTPKFGTKESDNKMTIGTPASANKVIAAAAYMTRDVWEFSYGVQPGGACLEDPVLEQTYDASPIGYYDQFAPGELAYFSGRGPRRDGVLKPEIATPGVGIASSFSHFTRHEEWPSKCQSYWEGGQYHFGTNRVLLGLESTILQGTSMACPNATGAVAVLLQQKADLNDACLRKVFQTTAAHDSATDVVAFSAQSAFTDTDGTVGASKPINNDWGYGKLDINASLGALSAYPVCTSGCMTSANCAAGYTCSPSADPCGCGTCVLSCKAAGASCTANSQCCSNTCSGKSGKKTCK